MFHESWQWQLQEYIGRLLYTDRITPALTALDFAADGMHMQEVCLHARTHTWIMRRCCEGMSRLL